MKFKRIILLALLLVLTLPSTAQSKQALQSNVRLELSAPMQKGALFHWKITNVLDSAVYVYDVFLWGPAYHVENKDAHIFVDTAPLAEQRSCPPNRFPPVLLLAVGPHRMIEGDFTDTSIKGADGSTISMRIQVGPEAYNVVKQAHRYISSRCKYSPYDAIVQWGTVLQSNSIRAGAALNSSTIPNR
jgi:hypothetical protein